jgi:hypothetical protein
VLSSLARILRLASLAICTITIVSFVLFAIDQTGTASTHQQKVLNGEASAPSIAGGPSAAAEANPAASASRRARRSASTAHERTVRRVIDEAAEALTSPFAGVLSSSSSEWAIRTVELLLALAVYGFALGYVARMVRVRA